MWPLLIFGALVAKRIVAEHDLESNYIPIRCDICGDHYWLHVAAKRGDIDRCDVCEARRRQKLVRAEKDSEEPEPRDAEFEAAPMCPAPAVVDCVIRARPAIVISDHGGYGRVLFCDTDPVLISNCTLMPPSDNAEAPRG